MRYSRVWEGRGEGPTGERTYQGVKGSPEERRERERERATAGWWQNLMWSNDEMKKFRLSNLASFFFFFSSQFFSLFFSTDPGHVQVIQDQEVGKGEERKRRKGESNRQGEKCEWEKGRERSERERGSMCVVCERVRREGWCKATKNWKDWKIFFPFVCWFVFPHSAGLTVGNRREQLQFGGEKRERGYSAPCMLQESPRFRLFADRPHVPCGENQGDMPRMEEDRTLVNPGNDWRKGLSR